MAVCWAWHTARSRLLDLFCPTYHLQCTGSARQFVLRKNPTGSLLKGAHSIVRECGILKALHALGVLAPQVVFESSDFAAFGSLFFVMKFVEGTVFRDFGPSSLLPHQRRIVYTHVAVALNHLHSTLIQAAGLS